MKVHHIGYAVKDINQSIIEFKNLGYKEIDKKQIDKKRNIEIQFMENGNYIVELISPIGDIASINNLLKKNGPIPYHICYEVVDIESKIKGFIDKGYILLEKPEEAIAIENKKVAFLYSKNIGVIEFLEK